MDLWEFHNRLRVLRSIDMGELEEAGVIARGDFEAWKKFDKDPFEWFIRAGDQQLEKLWVVVEQRATGKMATAELTAEERLEAIERSLEAEATVQFSPGM